MLLAAWKTVAYVAACLVIPILWGWIVNLMFTRWRNRRTTAAIRGMATSISACVFWVLTEKRTAER